MGLDIGSIMIKGVIIDKYNNIITSNILYLEGNVVEDSKILIKKLLDDIDLEKYRIVSVGTTGSGRKLIGKMLDACIIKNEITATAIGTLKVYPDVKTILEIGGKTSKIIRIQDEMISDYAINNSCSLESGVFLDMVVKRLGLHIQDVDNIVKKSKNKIDFSNRCTVFAYDEVIDRIQMGYHKEDILAGVCKAISSSYINNILRGKRILGPVVFNGGVSRNKYIIQEIENNIGIPLIVHKNSFLLGALGVAIMAKDSKLEKGFNYNADIYTNVNICTKCGNNCEIVSVYKNKVLDSQWGNRCQDKEFVKNI